MLYMEVPDTLWLSEVRIIITSLGHSTQRIEGEVAEKIQGPGLALVKRRGLRVRMVNNIRWLAPPMDRDRLMAPKLLPKALEEQDAIVDTEGHPSDRATDFNYILIQGQNALSDTQMREIQSLGVQFVEYLSGKAWLCRFEPPDLSVIRTLDYIRHVSKFPAIQKLAPELKHQESIGVRTVDIVLHGLSDEMASDLSQRVSRLTGVSPEDMSIRRGDTVIRTSVDPQRLFDIAKLDNVGSIQEVVELVLHSNVARTILNVDATQNEPTGLTGAGQTITVADTGFDKGDVNKSHHAFTGRVKQLVPVGRRSNTDDSDGHGTQVCGSVLGNGKSDAMGGLIQGTAPGAELIMQALLGPNEIGQLQYLDATADIDQFVWQHPDMVVCFSAGNDGEKATSLGHIGAQNGAKNCITVGQPGRDFVLQQLRPYARRPKPDLVAPGSMILSTASGALAQKMTRFGPSLDDQWAFSSGTSMSASLVAGCAAVLREGLQTGTPPLANPSASLIKAMLINGATDLKRPRREQGFGRVNVAQSIIIPGSTATSNRDFWEGKVERKGPRDSVRRDILLRQYLGAGVVATTATFKATMVYTNLPGAVLQINLNLIARCVIDGKMQVRHGNAEPVDKPDVYDLVNSVEQVVWEGLPADAIVTIEVANRELMHVDADFAPFSVVWAVSPS
ncbi:peptidase S8/S53 domain-containing protein [Hypoxylon argillaceum]|nr:peptidase S8/S53 domain-containing protein [Hypoxylon argillaceum]